MAEKEHWYNGPVAEKMLEMLTRIALAGVVAVASTQGLSAAIVGTLAASTAQLTRQRAIINKYEDNLLNFYRDKLSVLLHKPAKDLTREDLRKAATPQSEGGLGITTLQKQVQKFERFKKIKTYGQIASAALTAGLLIGIAAVSTIPLASFSLTALGIIGAAATFIDKSINTYTDGILAKHDEKTVTTQIYDIARRVKVENVPSIQVMDVFVRGSKKLQSDIKFRYGDEYANLTAQQKVQVVKDSESHLHVAALTDEINKGTIKPNALGFLAYGQGTDLLADCKKYSDLCAGTASSIASASSNEPSTSQHTEKLRSERQQHVSTLPTLH